MNVQPAEMKNRYPIAFELYPYKRNVDQESTKPAHHRVVIVGGGPVGLATALDLGLRGQPVVVLDDHEGAGLGSRAICFSKRTLDIANRLGAGSKMIDKGVVWQTGRVFHDRDEIYEFNLLPESGHRSPAFINLQQPYFEKFLFEGIEQANANGAQIDVRGRNCVDGVTSSKDGVTIDINTPDGAYSIETGWLIVCDGARSPVRDMMGLDFKGRVFEDNFLIADVKMKADFPTERWFWFEPWFKSGSSALLHKQPDDIWRIDFQLGWDIDREKEMEESSIRARVDMMLGDDVDYELDWCSIYTFQCRRMDKFRHDRVLFAGDSAHQVSPFGARGANSGVQDADNLGWKLDLVLRGHASEALLDSYNDERVYGADENIKNSTRTTDFLTPKSDISKVFRNAILDLAADHEFARPFVNSGRLSQPCVYDCMPLFGEDALCGGPAVSRPGAACVDGVFEDGFLLDQLGKSFNLLAINCTCPDTFDVDGLTVKTIATKSPGEEISERYLGGATSATYLIRPDQHVVARWSGFDRQAVETALRTSIGKAA